MKKIIFSSIGLLVLLTFTEVSAQVGIGTTTPNGALDINSSTNGFVPPRVTLARIDVAAPVVNPQAGALVAGTVVYNSFTSTLAAPDNVYNVTPGYYFWNGTVWVKFNAGNTSLDIEDDLRVTLDKPGSSTAAIGSLTGITGPQIYFFQDGVLDGMVFTLQLPHNWKDGTTIYPHIHWIPRADGAGNVQWKLDYTWANINTGTFTADPNSPINGIATGPFVMNKHLLTSIGTGISGTGKTYSSVLICRIYRDAQTSNTNDTYTNSAGGLSMDFHISIKNPFVEYP